MQFLSATGRASEPLESSSKSSRLTREQVVDRIIAINPTASTAFLERFRSESLEAYLKHLVVASGPRGSHSRWVRPAETPAITWREAQD